MSSDLLAHRIREPAAEPEGALVLFHGRGTSENDLFPMLDELDPERRLLGVTPRAPLTLPPGGAHWYVVPRVGFPDPETFFATYDLGGRWLDGLLAERGIPIERTVLGGFSQGAVMSYSFGLGPGRPRPAGIAAMSGFIPVVEGFELELGGLEGFPVAAAHGAYDPVISIDFGHAARDTLQQAGADLTWRESPMPHTVDPAFLAELRPWIVRVLGAT